MNAIKRSAQQHFHVSLTSSVRARLTLWYLAVMAVIVFVFGGSLYATQTYLNADTAESRLEAQLYQDSQQFSATYKQALLNQQAPGARQLNASAQEIVLLLRPDGSVLDARGPLTSSMIQQLQAKAGQNAGMTDVAVPPPSSSSHAPGWWGGWWNGSRGGGGGNSYRVLITPVLNQNARIGTLLVGLQRQDTVPLFAIWLFWGTAALLVAAIGGYWLAGKVLRPVKMITRTANEINATDLRRRLHLQRRDEFGELAATFDSMLARLEAAFRRQAQFTADASHELRTPLTVMNLEINRALTQLERPEDYRQVLEQVQAENEQLMTMVNSLLLLARADTGQMTLEWQEVDLSDIALAAVERLLPLAHNYQIALATGDLPELVVRGDPRYLGQMLTNLIENGIKHSSGVGTRVHVALAHEGRWGVIRIQDDGPGISKEHLPYLFERFYRVDKARSQQQRRPDTGNGPEHAEPGGTGLGLSIVQWIVQAHGGEVRVESVSGGGSLFEVRLPLLHSPQRRGDEGTAEDAADDKSMTKSESIIHDSVISALYTVPATPLLSVNNATSYGKEGLMSQFSLRQQNGTFAAFRVIVVCEALVFLLAATLHTGAFGVPALVPAMIVEGLCGIGCVISAYAIFAHKTWAPRAAIIIQILIFLGVLLGVWALVTGPDIRTTLNVTLHAIMLALILAGLSLLAIPGTREALRNEHAA